MDHKEILRVVFPSALAEIERPHDDRLSIGNAIGYQGNLLRSPQRDVKRSLGRRTHLEKGSARYRELWGRVNKDDEP